MVAFPTRPYEAFEKFGGIPEARIKKIVKTERPENRTESDSTPALEINVELEYNFFTTGM